VVPPQAVDYHGDEHGLHAEGSGAFGLNEDQEAEGFRIGRRNALLQSLHLALWFRTGVNALDVKLLNERTKDEASPGEPYEPDEGSVLESWRLTNRVTSRLAASGNVLRLDSALHPKLLAGKRYWVYISVPGDASAIAWLSSGVDYTGLGWFSERNSAIGFEWRTAAIPGFALRVRGLR